MTNPETLEAVCELLAVGPEPMLDALTTRVMTTAGETYSIPLTPEQVRVSFFVVRVRECECVSECVSV